MSDVPAPDIQRPINWPALIETGILASTAAVLLTKALRGVLIFYIHPRYTPLVFACGIVLLLVAGARMRAIFSEHPEPLDGRRLGYLFLLVPVLLGTLVPARPLSADSLATESINSNTNAYNNIRTASLSYMSDDTSQWNLLQWSMALSVQNAEVLSGKPVDLVAFVYHDSTRSLDGFIAARYVITCCTADGSGVGLPVIWPSGAALKANTWVHVRGTIGQETIGDSPESVIFASSVEEVSAPSSPYLYP